MSDSEPPFPWSLGVFDAHCHPTDTMTSISSIAHMQASALTIMATRGEDQALVDSVASTLSNTNKIIPCFGWHPWFAHQISTTSTNPDDNASKISHYRTVLTGSTPTDTAFFNTLPTPKPLSTLLAETRERLLAHPAALVGEIGLDKAFRLPLPWTPDQTEDRDVGLTPGSREGRNLSVYKVSMEHQKFLLKAQLQLAGELGRAVSVHSVQAHGAVFDVLQELWAGYERRRESRRGRRQRESEQVDESTTEEAEVIKSRPYPPRICMHSYSGSTEPLRQFLHPSVPSDVYFSFSFVINFTGPSVEKVVAVLKALPDDRILVESDLHCAGPEMDGLLERAVRIVCGHRGWALEEGVGILADNWRRFVFGR
ncbi:putative Cut9 interacting protein Scn1 [Talaromyces proteolyticus]|uniref:Cut9 interacting protein Scn1 n=1 Tax=Talaromyces proteolyticus TaxID=1131652 RepID=A0AAD4KWD1_9EURO|nr:putative Cut9 interacting protein Scn1 [Talaromyces proteolyticus]KAH8700442.1 putative Cut9 interacting protein Scn1 [Talaromyces proteolyticus]